MSDTKHSESRQLCPVTTASRDCQRVARNSVNSFASVPIAIWNVYVHINQFLSLNQWTDTVALEAYSSVTRSQLWFDCLNSICNQQNAVNAATSY